MSDDKNGKDPGDSTQPARPAAIDDERQRRTRDLAKTRDLAGQPLAPDAPLVRIGGEDAGRRATVGYEHVADVVDAPSVTAVDRVDPRAVAPTIDSDEASGANTTPGFGATHCPVCGALVRATDACSECGHEFEDPRLGTIVSGRYQVDSLIGAGGFGRVYRGIHLTIGEPVAIKFLLEEFSRRPEQRARFKREAVALAKMRHPSIVAVHDYGEHLGELYMVMELVRGTQLFDRIRDERGELMPVARVCAIMDQLLAVLEVAHGMGIVHRDLKPENVMLLETGDRVDRIKVLDFGLALMDDRTGGERLTATRAVQGTPIYMSPEQCKGRDVTASTDIYAAGVMMFELLSGDPPFESDSAPELMAKHMFVEPPSLAEKGIANVLPGVEALVRRALSKRAEERPTAREFRDAIEKALEGTDEASIEARQGQARVEHAALSREQRALVDASAEHAGRPRDSMAPPAAEGTMPRVYLWALDSARADTLRSALAVHGVNAAIWKSEDAPDAAALAKRPAKALIVGGVQSLERVSAARSHEPTAKLPVLVIDPWGATPALIRAGASDVSPAGSNDEAICKQIVRLIRRGR
ncbi:MAG: protein kinase [Myxococcales bacterium]|nr:protein kinase [Myxococcales bacterium]